MRPCEQDVSFFLSFWLLHVIGSTAFTISFCFLDHILKINIILLYNSVHTFVYLLISLFAIFSHALCLKAQIFRGCWRSPKDTFRWSLVKFRGLELDLFFFFFFFLNFLGRQVSISCRSRHQAAFLRTTNHNYVDTQSEVNKTAQSNLFLLFSFSF